MAVLVRILASAASLLAVTGAFAQAPFTAADLNALKRISDPQVSPDGRYTAFVLRETDTAANRGRTDIWLIDLTAKAPVARRLTQNPANDSNPRWSPDSRTIYFLSTRSGSSQVWRLPLDGGDALQVTDYPLDVGTMKVSPTGRQLALSIEVFPDCADLTCTKQRLDATAESPESGLSYDRLFVRHWDTWANGTRSHLFTAALDEDGTAAAPIDVSKPLDGDVPSKPFGGDEEYAWSRDGTRIAFSLRVAGRTEAWSTNFDVFEARSDGSSAPVNLTASNPAWDTQPNYLADGRLAWLAMERPGFEADRFRVMIRDAAGASRTLTGDWDRSVARLVASTDGRLLFATADDVGQHALYTIDPGSGRRTEWVGEGQVTDVAPARTGVVIGWANLASPVDLFAVSSARAAPKRLSRINDDVLSKRTMSSYEQFTFAGWNGETVHGYVVRPFGMVAGKKYPIAYIVHGGPQVSFGNQWSYRWNPQVFAGDGHGVVFVDFHGSPGYGQAFTDSISEDWGGKPFEDLQKGLAAAVQQFDWLDGDRACALGASYGGYMQNWIAGQWPERFRCIVNHAGIFDQRAMAYATEELWFTEWENGGPHFEVPRNYEAFNPVAHVAKWRTPMLVTHGVLDYRVPYTQSLATFTALQRRRIESKLLIFPDENHWVLKPANSVLWYETVLDWLDKHLKR